tara:strand:+ start:5499 stop:6656 length:1158 start_codon:yes stop_codon:yes gene_type:complete
MSKKETIAVFFGGVSPEHDISIVTAISSVIRPLELDGRYQVLPIYISKKGIWYSDSSFKKIETFSGGGISELLDKLKPVSVTFDGGLTIEKPGLKRSKIKVGIAFPAMHGGNGEDGSLMGLLRMANIPFVGCDMPASVIAMDKLLAKQVAEANGTPVVKYEYLYADAFAEKPDKIIGELEKSLEYPLFVKPTHLGSSIGISRVSNRKELQNGIEVALYYDNKVLVEEAVPNLVEVTVPIIGNEVMMPALVERPLINDNNVFDFDTKYMNSGKKSGGKHGSQGYSELPAKLPGKLYEASIDIARSVYKAAECEGIARVDLLIDSKSNTIYFNEINPMPGSLYSHNWRKSGISNVELVAKLIELARQRYEKHKKLEKTFSTNFLKQF